MKTRIWWLILVALLLYGIYLNSWAFDPLGALIVDTWNNNPTFNGPEDFIPSNAP